MGHAHWLTTLFAKLLDFWYHISWTIASNRWLFVILFILIGVLLANPPIKTRGTNRRFHPYLMRSLIGALAGVMISSALVATSAITHAADARWLPPAQRHGPQVPAPSVPSAPNVPLVGSALGVVTKGVNSGLKDMASGTNTALHPLLELEVEAKAIRIATHIIVQFTLISFVSGITLAALLWISYKHEQWRSRKRLGNAEKRIKALEERLDALTGPVEIK